jgi:integrase
MTHRLIDSYVRHLTPPSAGNRVVYDADVRGFGARVTAAGAKSFVLNYRANGRERRITIGSFPDWTVAAARDKAKEFKRGIDAGEDPIENRQATRTAPTIGDLAERYLDYAKNRKRPRSLIEDQGMLRRVILPALGHVRVAALSRGDVTKMFADVSKRAPIQANRVLSLLRRMINLAITEFGMRDEPNPARAIERNPENRRTRYLEPEELGRLLGATAEHRNQQSANVIKLALLTGARRGELLTATWDQFNVRVGTWSKPASVTKQRRLHTVPLNGPARELLVTMKAAADLENGRRQKHRLPPLTHLFPGYGANDAQGDLKRTWQTVCKAAGITDLRFHDLRHSFASFLASSGHNLPLIGAMLGHSSPSTTQRYSHLLLDPQRQAAERVGEIVAGAGKEVAEVVPIPARRA